MNEKGFNGLILAELVKIANDVFTNEIARRNKKSGFSLRTIAGDNKVYLSYNDADSNGHKELCATLEKAALIDIKSGFFASNVIPLLSGRTGGVWPVAPDRAAVFDDKTARTGVVMPAFTNDSICPDLKCNIKALDRAKAPIIPEKEPVREPGTHLPALYVDAQTKTPAFVFALVALIDFISRWFYHVWGTIRPKANADELFWGDFRRFHTKGNHRIRDGTKEANKPKL